MPGAGASSSTFWWRRWIEQSRSNRRHGVAVRVGENLDLDMARAGQVAFDQHLVVAEAKRRLALCAVDGGWQVRRAFDDAHAFAAAAGDWP